MSRRVGPRGRETAAAESRTRRIWYGWGQLGRAEKSGFGVFLNDIVRIYAEVSVVSLPALLLIMASPTTGWPDAKATGLLAWMTAVVVGTLIRGGWVTPLWTSSLGWVTLAPSLLLLRVPYFNLALAAAAYGGVAVAAVAGQPLVGLGWAFATGVLSMLAFPAVAQRWVAR